MNHTFNDTDKTEPYIYVIVILGPILFLFLLQKCLLHTSLCCHRGTCCFEDEDYNYDIDIINESINGNKVAEAEAEAEADEDRLDGFDNLSI